MDARSKGLLKMKVNRLIKQDPSLVLDVLLEHLFIPSELTPNVEHKRVSDDTDGLDSYISVFVSNSGVRAGDVSFKVFSHFDEDSLGFLNHVFRSGLGGGGSPRVRNGLLFLARAIQIENETNPQPQR